MCHMQFGITEETQKQAAGHVLCLPGFLFRKGYSIKYLLWLLMPRWALPISCSLSHNEHLKVTGRRSHPVAFWCGEPVRLLV